MYGNFKLILNDEKLYGEMSVPSNVFGDGSASEKISAVPEEKSVDNRSARRYNIVNNIFTASGK